MKLSDLNIIDSLPHLSEFSGTRLVTELSLYEKILITTDDINLDNSLEDDPATVIVSKDVQTLHKFFNSEENILLPCPECQGDRTFEQTIGWNPRESNTPEKRNKFPRKVVMPVSDYAYQAEPTLKNIGGTGYIHYVFGRDYLTDLDTSIFQESDWNQFCSECGNFCINEIMKKVPEFRKDYQCSLNDNHKGYVDFIIVPAVTEKPDELVEYETRLRKKQVMDAGAILDKSEDEEETECLYNKYIHALFLIKIGQYPSLRDLQLFDTRKYRKVLGDSYRDYTFALALYADGIGVGSFVYLRRILEKLVEEVHQDCASHCIKENVSQNAADDSMAEETVNNLPVFNEEEYRNLRFNEKIDYLEKNFERTIIPKELNEIRGKIYGVFSKGVHKASDQECLELFPAAQFVIESLLDEKIQQKEHAEKLAFVKKQFLSQ